MKIYYVSDLHLDFHPDYRLPKCEGEDDAVLIIAGDVCEVHLDKCANNISSFLSNVSERFKNVIWISGNHEYYFGSVDNTISLLREIANATNTIFLEKEIVEIDGKRFLGTTLWTDLWKNPLSMLEVKQSMNDFKQVEGLDIDWWIAEHEKSKQWLEENIMQGDIVITHHSPNIRSCPQHHRSSMLSAGFCSYDMVGAFYKEPVLWIHGHIHTPCDYYVGDTRVVCNPKGYSTNPHSQELVELV